MIGKRLDVNFFFPEKYDRIVTVNNAIENFPVLKNCDSYNVLDYKKANSNSCTKLMRGTSEKASLNYVSRNKDYVLECYKYIKLGHNWRVILEELMRNYANTKNWHSGIYKTLDTNTLSVVIANYRKNILILPFGNRGLLVREVTRIQSFSDTFIFK